MNPLFAFTEIVSRSSLRLTLIYRDCLPSPVSSLLKLRKKGHFRKIIDLAGTLVRSYNHWLSQNSRHFLMVDFGRIFFYAQLHFTSSGLHENPVLWNSFTIQQVLSFAYRKHVNYVSFQLLLCHFIVSLFMSVLGVGGETTLYVRKAISSHVMDRKFRNNFK